MVNYAAFSVFSHNFAICDGKMITFCKWQIDCCVFVWWKKNITQVHTDGEDDDADENKCVPCWYALYVPVQNWTQNSHKKFSISWMKGRKQQQHSSYWLNAPQIAHTDLWWTKQSKARQGKATNCFTVWRNAFRWKQHNTDKIKQKRRKKLI